MLKFALGFSKNTGFNICDRGRAACNIMSLELKENSAFNRANI